MKMTRTDLCGSWIMIIWKIWPPCSRKSMVSWTEFLYIIKSWSPLITTPGIMLCMSSANEKRRYIATPPLIGWAHTQQDACIQLKFSLKYLLILSTAQGFVRSRAFKKSVDFIHLKLWKPCYLWCYECYFLYVFSPWEDCGLVPHRA